MIRGRVRALALAMVILVAVAALAFAFSRSQPAPSERPHLLLLTSLPLVFNEDFAIDGGGSPALEALQSRYRVIPISVTDPGELAKGRLLLMAHPLAQTAQNLVALDAWVRDGGRVLLLADPILDWPSKRPLGDTLRAPPSFADTGLIGHWGLRLYAPDKRGTETRKLGGYDIMTASPGYLDGTSCRISEDRLVARCRIGKGQAIIIADADLLDVADLGGGSQHNLDAILSELSKLQH